MRALLILFLFLATGESRHLPGKEYKTLQRQFVFHEIHVPSAQDDIVSCVSLPGFNAVHGNDGWICAPMTQATSPWNSNITHRQSAVCASSVLPVPKINEEVEINVARHFADPSTPFDILPLDNQRATKTFVSLGSVCSFPVVVTRLAPAFEELSEYLGNQSVFRQRLEYSAKRALFFARLKALGMIGECLQDRIVISFRILCRGQDQICGTLREHRDLNRLTSMPCRCGGDDKVNHFFHAEFTNDVIRPFSLAPDFEKSAESYLLIADEQLSRIDRKGYVGHAQTSKTGFGPRPRCFQHAGALYFNPDERPL